MMTLVKGSEFLRKLHALARRRELPLRFVPARGKGSHGTVYLGSMSSVLKDLKKELGPGLLRAMCKDLGIDPREL
jgi:mRNA interferase HicA